MPHDDTMLATAMGAAKASLDRLSGSIDAPKRAQLARTHKAFRRSRVFLDADTLLLCLLFYVHANVSLRLTAWFARVAFRVTVTDQSLSERFQRCGEWLQALLTAQLAATLRLSVASRTRLRIVDGSVLCRDGAVGTEYRVHVIFDPGASAPTSVEVTDSRGAEGLNQGTLEARSLALGDRNYGRYRELETARLRHVDLLARTHLPTQPMQDAQGVARTPQYFADEADRGVYDRSVRLTRKNDPPLPARLIVVPLPPEAAGRARQKVRKEARKKGRQPDVLTLHLAGYLCLITTLDAVALSLEQACSLYRIRWQVECFLKRAKSLGDLGKIRGGDALVRVQIWARLLSLCHDEARRPAEANETAALGARTGRPPAQWRWLQCLRILWLAPLATLAEIGARRVPVKSQDDALRERPRKRGRRALLEAFPFLAPVSP
jgi:hypothetical protein